MTADHTDTLSGRRGGFDRSWLGAFYAVIVLGFVAGGWVVSRFPIAMPPCALRTWTGVPCLTCGSTRCFMALSHGHVLEAFLYNPLVFTGSLALFAWGVAVAAGGLSGRPVRMPRLTPERRRWLLPTVIVLALANWGWLILTLPE